MSNKFKNIDSKLLFKNPYWQYKLDQYIMPSGNLGNYHYVDSRGSTMIIPVDKNGTFFMTKQYRYLNSMDSIEFPGGGIKEGLDESINALEELEEECGLICKNLKKIGTFNPFNGVTNEICTIFVATELSAGMKRPDESENIEVLRFTELEINDMISTNQIWDGMSLAAWLIYLNKK